MADDETGGGTSARDRRAERVRQQSRRDMPKKVGKNVAIALAIVLVFAGAVWAYNEFQPPGEIHHHIAIAMYTDGERVDFDNRAFDLSTTQYLRAHLHVPSDPDSILHVEGLPGVSLARFFESIQITTSSSKVTLHPVVHGGAAYENNSTHEWQVLVDKCADGPDNWEPAGGKFGYEPGQHDRVLMTFTARGATVEQLADQTGAVPTDAQITSAANDTCDGGAPVGDTMPGIFRDDDRRIARPL